MVSIIIPCYNQAHFLAEAVQSALDQDYPCKEVIVVNDGSPDNTREIAASFGEQITYIEQENRGLSGARNTGIKAAKGNYIAFLDSDDVYLPTCLATEATFLNAHPDTALVCSDAVLFNEDGELGLKSACSGQPKSPHNFRWETVAYCPTPSTVMMRRSCFEKVGLFDETLKNAAEDWLMWVQMSLYFNMAYFERPLIRYRVHGKNATLNVERINRGNRYAVDKVVRSLNFAQYPAHFRAKLLFYRFAAAWHVEPKTQALHYFLRAIFTDITQLPYGLQVIRQGVHNILKRRRAE